MQLRAAPVTALHVVLDLVVRLHTEPVRDRAVMSESLGVHIPVLALSLSQLDLGAERLVRRLHVSYERRHVVHLP